MMADKYKIVRFRFKGSKRTICTGLTLQEAQEHCQDPESNSRTCTGAIAKRRTRKIGAWFDGYTKE
jgi:hypothetical protein